jgi:hypothetical protein
MWPANFHWISYIYGAAIKITSSVFSIQTKGGHKPWNSRIFSLRGIGLKKKKSNLKQCEVRTY